MTRDRVSLGGTWVSPKERNVPLQMIFNQDLKAPGWNGAYAGIAVPESEKAMASYHPRNYELSQMLARRSIRVPPVCGSCLLRLR